MRYPSCGCLPNAGFDVGARHGRERRLTVGVCSGGANDTRCSATRGRQVRRGPPLLLARSGTLREPSVANPMAATLLQRRPEAIGATP